MLDRKEIEEIVNGIKEKLEYQELQIKKLEDARDISDEKFTEMSVATDAIRFDHEAIKKDVKKLKDML